MGIFDMFSPQNFSSALSDPNQMAMLRGAAAMMDGRGTYGSFGAALNNGLNAYSGAMAGNQKMQMLEQLIKQRQAQEVRQQEAHESQQSILKQKADSARQYRYALGRPAGIFEEAGPIRPGEDVPTYRSPATGFVGHGDMGRLGREVLGIPGYEDVGLRMLKQANPATNIPMDVQTAQWYMNATPEQKKAFDHTKRSQQYLNAGDAFVNTHTGNRIEKGLAPNQTADYLEKSEVAKQTGKILGKDQAESIRDLSSNLQEAETTIRYLDELIGSEDGSIKPHPGFRRAVGGSSYIPFVRGTPAADFVARLDQVQGQQFMQAYQSLKGGGQITEVEGIKAERAIARMQKSQSEEEFISSVREFQSIIRKGMDRARSKAGAAPAVNEFDALWGE